MAHGEGIRRLTGEMPLHFCRECNSTTRTSFLASPPLGRSSPLRATVVAVIRTRQPRRRFARIPRNPQATRRSNGPIYSRDEPGHRRPHRVSGKRAKRRRSERASGGMHVVKTHIERCWPWCRAGGKRCPNRCRTARPVLHQSASVFLNLHFTHRIRVAGKNTEKPGETRGSLRRCASATSAYGNLHEVAETGFEPVPPLRETGF